MGPFGSQTRVEPLNLHKKNTKIGLLAGFAFGDATTKSPQTLKMQPPHSHPSGKKTAAKGNGVPGSCDVVVPISLRICKLSSQNLLLFLNSGQWSSGIISRGPPPKIAFWWTTSQNKIFEIPGQALRRQQKKNYQTASIRIRRFFFGRLGRWRLRRHSQLAKKKLQVGHLALRIFCSFLTVGSGVVE